MPQPILYSLRNCPFAIRARLGLALAKQKVTVQEVALNHKPAELLAASAKGTVPVLIVEDTVIDESVAIMLWALRINDPNNLLYHHDPTALPEMLQLINHNDVEFIDWLEQYKLATRYRDPVLVEYRQHCQRFVLQLEQRLNQHDFFVGPTASLADYAIFPFIRQFARVERHWYLQAPYPNLRRWLDRQLQSALFTRVMAK